MRNSVVIFFLFVYLFSSTQLSELLKIPLLVEHYSEHQKESTGLSFTDFLYIHYVDYENHSDDRDSDLPYQSHSNSEISYYHMPLIASVYMISSLTFSDQIEEKSFDCIDHFQTSYFLSSIWQPPRLV